MVKDELGITLDKADESVLGVAAKVLVSKEGCTIIGDGRTQVRGGQGGGGVHKTRHRKGVSARRRGFHSGFG
jgi:hypothetical protein